MKFKALEGKLHPELFKGLAEEISELRPAQEKSFDKGLLNGESQLICTPTASGKTLIAELAMLNNLYNNKGKAIYIVPLKALATEKYRHFKTRYNKFKTAMAIGDHDSKDKSLADKDIIITTSEKLDSLIRHHCPWLRQVKTVIIDEIHLLNDPGRGPTLEILITLLRMMLQNIQLVGLSATIGNASELSGWLQAHLITDDWRPVELCKGVMSEDKLYFY
ncbi:MAG: DEAD/DEAH box helicase [Nanobdellota archaeon]